jgi:hypothetical protein
MENWKPAPGYENLYHVSDFGRVKRLAGCRSRAERILKPGRMTSGYLFVSLCKGGIPKIHSLHRLVMATFIGPCPEGMEVNHKNGERTDARLENLEYISHRENIIHGHRTLPRKPTSLRGDMLPNAVLNESIVREVLARYKAGEIRKDIAVSMGLKRHLVYMVCSRKSWKWVSL